MKSIFSRFAAGLLAALLLLSAAIVLVVFTSIRVHYTDLYSGDLLRVNRTLAHIVEPMLANGDSAELANQMEHVSREAKFRVTIIRPDGKVIYDSEKDSRKMDNHRYRREIVEAEENGQGFMIRYSNTIHEDMLYSALAIRHEGKIIGYSRLSLHMREIRLLINKMTGDITGVTLTIIILSFVIMLFISRRYSRQINRLVSASGQVADGDFSARVNIRSKGEFKALADAFNFMTGEISSLFRQIKIKNEQLDRIVMAINGGLVVFDRMGKVVLNNAQFNAIVDYERVSGRYYWELVRDEQFTNDINSILRERRPHQAEVVIKGKYFLMSANWIEGSEELVVVLNDISEMKTLEKIKKDFVINVSHELRTPLTAIKGFIETLEENLENDNKRYIGIVKKNTDRLINIVQDLQILSSLEDTQISLEMSRVSIAEIIENVLKLYEQKIREKGLEVEIDIDKGTGTIQADEFRLEQVFINLIDNAVKYTDQGKISIHTAKEEDKLVITIADSGLGIPAEDRERIFERFYTVDKSRSRKLGGTGLGLSIVKHIILRHNGRISLESESGKGTIFRIELSAAVSSSE